MAEIFVTISIEAKDKMEATTLVKNKLQCINGSEIVGVSSTNPYDIINELENENDRLNERTIYG